MSNQATKDAAGFAPGEPPEQMVGALRDCLRRNDLAGAQARFADLSERLLRLVDHKARAYFDRRPDLVEDALQEAVVLLWQRLSDLRPLSGLLHFERRFHQSLATTLSDAFAAVLRHAHGQTEVPDSATAAMSSGEADQDAPTAIAQIADASALRSFDDVLGEASANALLSRLPDARHADALRRWSDGESRREIAAHFGCSERTVYNWIEGARAALRAHLQATHGQGYPDA